MWIVLGAAIITALIGWFFIENNSWPVIIAGWIGVAIGWFSRDLVIEDRQSQKAQQDKDSEALDH